MGWTIPGVNLSGLRPAARLTKSSYVEGALSRILRLSLNNKLSLGFIAKFDCKMGGLIRGDEIEMAAK